MKLLRRIRDRMLISKQYSWAMALLLLFPSLILLGIVFVYAMFIFGSYSFYAFEGGSLKETFQWNAYMTFFSDPFYWKIIKTTFLEAIKATMITLILAYPLAYYIAYVSNKIWRQTLLVITFMPLLVSAVVRSYGWIVLLSKKGLLNWLFIKWGLTSTGFDMVFNETGVIIALVHIFLPFMVLPILSVLVQLDPALKQAAYDLGANHVQTFMTVTLPLSVRGIVAGVQIVFTLCLTAFSIPTLLGGGRVMTLTTFIYHHTLDLNWPMAAVASFFLIAVSSVVVFSLNWLVDKIYFQGVHETSFEGR